MFPSQPQIGYDMARERRDLAARVKLVTLARDSNERRDQAPSHRRRIELRLRAVLFGPWRRIDVHPR